MFETKLEGRMTLTALLVPYIGNPDLRELRYTVVRALKYFMPADCDDLRPPPPPSRTALPFGEWQGLVAFLPKPSWWWAWTDAGDSDLQPGSRWRQRKTTAAGWLVVYMFRLWNGLYGGTPEREEASAKNPLSKESWAQAVAKAMPPVTAWEQERWDIQLAPSYIIPEREEAEEGEEEE